MTLKKIFNYLNIKIEESEKVLLLLIQSVSIGGIISFYYTFANGLFISTFSLDKLPVAYIFSGILGLTSSLIFSKVQKKYNASKVLQYLLLIVSLFLLSFKITYDFASNPKITEYLIWIVFICFVPISTMLAISFAAILMRFFNLREGKRLFPIIYSGEVIASIIAFTLIPIMLNFDKTNDDTSFLLYFSIAGAIVSFFFQSRIYNKYQHLFKIQSKLTKKNVGKISLQEIINNKYYLSIVVLSIISVFCFILVEFSFSKTSKEAFLTKSELTAFIGIIFVFIKLLEFIFKTFVSGRAVEKYGLKLGLSILPVFLILIILLYFLCSFLVGRIDITFPKLDLTFTILLFGFSLVLKKSFEIPTFNLLYQPLDSEKKVTIQTLVSGKSKLLGTVIAGLTLLILSDLDSFLPVIFTILFILIILWLYMISLVNLSFKSFLSSLLKKKKEKIQNRISDNIYANSFELLLKEKNPLIHKHFTGRLVPGFQEKKLFQKNTTTKNESLKKLINSVEPEDHVKALIIIYKNWNEDYTNFVCSCALSDSNQVMKTAIAVLSLTRIDNNLVDNFLNSLLNPSWSIGMFFLLNLGYNYSKTVERINQNIQKNSNFTLACKLEEISLIQVLAKNDNKFYDDFLLEKIINSDSEIEFHALKSLSTKKITYSFKNKLILKNILDTSINHYSWILSCILDLLNLSEFKTISSILIEELEYVKDKIYLILSLLYSSEEISQIQNALRGDDSQEIVLAMEMLENILDDEIKESILPVFDESLYYPSKYSKLALLFPQMRMSPNKRLENIINYNFKFSMDFLRVTAIQKLGQLYDGDNRTILANIFNKNSILKKASYLSLFKTNQTTYLKYLRMEKEVDFKDSLSFLTSGNNKLPVEDKVELLYSNNFFPNVPKIHLFKIASFCETNLEEASEKKMLKENDFVLFVISGKIKLTMSDGTQKITIAGQILGSKNPIYHDKVASIQVDKDTRYLRILLSDLNSILITEPKIVLSLINNLPSLKILRRKNNLS